MFIHARNFWHLDTGETRTYIESGSAREVANPGFLLVTCERLSKTESAVRPTVEGMKSRAQVVSFGLFVVVALAALFYVLRSGGRDNLALAGGLAAIIAIRAAMFIYNLKRQKDRVEGRKPKPETKLDL